MECKRCGNKDPAYFYKGHKGWYCRKCVSFKRILLQEELTPLEYEVNKDVSEYYLKYPLTSYQEEVSIKCLESLKNSDVLLHCVCGAGKTELVVRSISHYLKRGLKVCYAISRKEVVKELYIRFKTIFPFSEIVALYGGHHEKVTGDLIICTTHQLFRYYKTFDLLILDEVDAFPLSGNIELMNIALNSAKGRVIFSTATVNDFLINVIKKRKIVELKLLVRPSLKPLIVPRLIHGPKIFLLFNLYMLMKKMTNQCIIFVTSKRECEMYYKIFKNLFSCTYAHAGLSNSSENIIAFKEKKFKYIYATTILERGITVNDINVIILNFIKDVFNEENLIQMLGRVGRNFNNPYGEAYILSKAKNKIEEKAINSLIEANKVYEMSVL